LENNREHIKDKNSGNKKCLKNYINILKFLKGERPDYNNLHQPDHCRAEEKYQKKQKGLIEKHPLYSSW